MKTKTLLFAIFATIAFNVNAQSDDSNYLNKAIDALSSGDCESAQKFYNVYKELSGNSKPSVQVLIDDCKNASKKETNTKKTSIDLENNSFCEDNKNRYIAWNIGGAGYPWNIVTGIEFRGGNLIGIGLYGDIGMDFTHIMVHRYGESDMKKTTKTAFRYAGGIKFYPYKGLFLDCGYGTIAKPSAEVEYNYDTYSYDAFGWITDKSDKANISKKIKNSHGILFHVGYNFVTDLSGGPGFFLGFSGGASYDVINKVVAPSFNLKVGIAWGWNK